MNGNMRLFIELNEENEINMCFYYYKVPVRWEGNTNLRPMCEVMNSLSIRRVNNLKVLPAHMGNPNLRIFIIIATIIEGQSYTEPSIVTHIGLTFQHKWGLFQISRGPNQNEIITLFNSIISYQSE